ncbi:MAG: hypothetical protein J3K34DRAFT_197542 [Monoraphidium minutum]|nr:MAG: hypothetical protein J3K34DRAFT_197542 [Monoraphidium minutum]
MRYKGQPPAQGAIRILRSHKAAHEGARGGASPRVPPPGPMHPRGSGHTSCSSGPPPPQSRPRLRPLRVFRSRARAGAGGVGGRGQGWGGAGPPKAAGRRRRGPAEKGGDSACRSASMGIARVRAGRGRGTNSAGGLGKGSAATIMSRGASKGAECGPRSRGLAPRRCGTRAPTDVPAVRARHGRASERASLAARGRQAAA